MAVQDLTVGKQVHVPHLHCVVACRNGCGDSCQPSLRLKLRLSSVTEPNMTGLMMFTGNSLY